MSISIDVDVTFINKGSKLCYSMYFLQAPFCTPEKLTLFMFRMLLHSWSQKLGWYHKKFPVSIWFTRACFDLIRSTRFNFEFALFCSNVDQFRHVFRMCKEVLSLDQVYSHYSTYPNVFLPVEILSVNKRWQQSVWTIFMLVGGRGYQKIHQNIKVKFFSTVKFFFFKLGS